MTKRERIAALEKRIDALEREVASLPRWHWTYPQSGWIETKPAPPMKFGDGTADVHPIVSPTITWTTGTNSPSGVTQ
ncbi:MAG: hypothetical protein WA014_02550 [Minisyncoccia bacterium]